MTRSTQINQEFSDLSSVVTVTKPDKVTTHFWVSVDADVYYTVDGSTPAAGGPFWTAALGLLILDADLTLKMIEKTVSAGAVVQFVAADR